jgi:purine nucleoside phosphorylase
MLNRIQEAVDFIQTKTQVKPEFGIILGTGLGGFQFLQ